MFSYTLSQDILSWYNIYWDPLLNLCKIPVRFFLFARFMSCSVSKWVEIDMPLWEEEERSVSDWFWIDVLVVGALFEIEKLLFK